MVVADARLPAAAPAPDAPAFAQPPPASLTPPSSTSRQSPAAAAPSPRKAEALRDAGPEARQATEQPKPAPPSPAEVKVAVLTPPPQPAIQEPPRPQAPSDRAVTTLATLTPPPRPGDDARSPTWLRKPTGKEMAQVYEEYAVRRDLSGSAILSCAVAASGSVHSCRVDSETPSGVGFGRMALRLSPQFQGQARDP